MFTRGAALWLLAASSWISPAVAQPSDSTVCAELFRSASRRGLTGAPITEVIPFVGKTFLGSPYAAGTLESSAPEHLVVNLRTFDCVTYIECVLSISRCISARDSSYPGFRRNLQLFRYRDGTIAGYPSRLHYFAAWIEDNERKGLGRNITGELGGKAHRKRIDFMSKHRRLYPSLARDSDYAAMRRAEVELTRRPIISIPAGQVAGAEPLLKTGDVIAFTSATPGLDVSHTGFAIRMDDGSLHLLHASEPGGRIRISAEPLDRYIRLHPDQTGIIVFRPSEPRP